MKRTFLATLAALPLALAACSDSSNPDNWHTASDISSAIQEVNGNCPNPDDDPELKHGDCGTQDGGVYYYAFYGDEHELDYDLVVESSMMVGTDATRLLGDDWVIWCWSDPDDNCGALHEVFGGELTTHPAG